MESTGVPEIPQEKILLYKDITILDIINSSDKASCEEMIKYVRTVRRENEKKYGKKYDPSVSHIGKRKRYGIHEGTYGRAYERFVEDYFIDNSLPYWMNACVTDETNNTIGEFDFIIPGGVIEVKNIICGEKTVAALYDLVQRMKKMIQLIPQQFEIFFIMNPDIADVNYIQHILSMSTKYDYSRIKLVTDPSQITFAPYEYLISHRKHLDRMASLNNLSHTADVKLLKNKTNVLMDVYDDLSNYMLPEEESRLKEYNLKIINDQDIAVHNCDQFIVYFHKHLIKKTIRAHKINEEYVIQNFEQFYNYKIPFKFIPCGLDFGSGSRKPHKHDPRFNTICESCQCINVIKHKTCFGCKKIINHEV
jgi:hypothetical protein